MRCSIASAAAADRRRAALGLGCDANISYGITPMDQRERWREAIDLMLKAWTAKEFFAWNGKSIISCRKWIFGSRGRCRIPHPPLLVPGAASCVDVGLLPRPQSAIRLSELFRRQIR